MSEAHTIDMARLGRIRFCENGCWELARSSTRSTGRNKPKSSLRGLACPRPPQGRRSPDRPLLPRVARYEGKPLKCDGEDGYQRDPITGVIRRVVSVIPACSANKKGQ